MNRRGKSGETESERLERLEKLEMLDALGRERMAWLRGLGRRAEVRASLRVIDGGRRLRVPGRPAAKGKLVVVDDVLAGATAENV